MQPSLILWIIGIVLATSLGLVLGWLIWGRAAAQLVARTRALEDEADALQRECVTLGQSLAGEQVRAARVDESEAAREVLRQEVMDTREQLARLEAQKAERDRAFADQLRQIDTLKTELTQLFEASAGQLLSRNQDSFFQLANETFSQHRSQAGEQLGGLIGPVTEQLQRAEAKIEALEKARIDAYAALREQIGAMREGQDLVRAEAAKLSTALRSSSKLRGSWGEQQLRNVLEMAGLSPYTDFRTEVSVEAEDGRLRPDAVIRMPGGRHLVIDAKTSLAAFQQAVEASDDSERRGHLAAHARAMKEHAVQLSRKKYHDQFTDAADFVVMFVPGEHFFAAAMEADISLWETAYAQRIIICTPITLIALAKTVSQMWRQEKMADTAKEIAALAKELYRRLVKMGEHVEGVGKSLEQTVRRYNGFVGSLETSVLPQARKFTELNVDGTDAPLETLATVETATRLPVAGRDLKLVARTED